MTTESSDSTDSDGSKYTNPTGEGYLGVWTVTGWSATIDIGTFQDYQWRSDDDIYVIDDPVGIALVEDPPGGSIPEDRYLGMADVQQGTVGTQVVIPAKALRQLEGFTADGDIRAYERSGGGIRLVPKADDPLVTDGGTDRIDSLDDLPAHPTDRVQPGVARETHAFLRDRVQTAHEATTEQLYGLIVVAATTIHVVSEDAAVAAHSAATQFPAGDFDTVALDVRAIDHPDPDALLEEWHHRQDDSYPAFAVDLIGAGRFYMWASDGAAVGDRAPAVIHTGDFDRCGVAITWLATIDEVDVTHLAVTRQNLRRRIERASDAASTNGGDRDE